MHWYFTNADQSVVVNLDETSNNGAVWGTVRYQGQEYPVTGLWQALNGGNNAARKTSNFKLSGQADLGSNAQGFLAVSGLIRGTAPNMTSMEITLSAASTATGEVSQVVTELLPGAQPPAPPNAVSPPSGGGQGSISWQLGSADGSAVLLASVVENGGPISGTLVLRSGDTRTTYLVQGQWKGLDQGPGQTGSSFVLTGDHEAAPGAADLLAAAGVITGSDDLPQKIELEGNVASISEWTNTPFRTELLPMSQNDSIPVTAAYARSFMVIQIGGSHDEPQATKGWIGPIDANGNVGNFEGGNYSAGTSMSAEQLADIVISDPNVPATNDIRVPPFQSGAGSRPVMIQFIGDAGHFAQPPLSEYHPEILSVWYDTEVGALVLQFADDPSDAATSPIHFNHGRERNHNSVIIEPR